MLVNGCDCSIVIKTTHLEKDIPYSDETIREAVSFLQEEASIEGDGVYRGLRKTVGVTGCVVTPLTIGTAPLLFYLAMGTAGNPVFISETRNMYQYHLNLVPMEDTEHFDLLQDRSSNNEQLTNNNERKLYEGCRVESFELRIMRNEAIKLKLDITSECIPVFYPYLDTFEREAGERFNGDSITYKINGQEYRNIYGFTLVSRKQGGIKTEIWIKRALQKAPDIPSVIEDMTITAQLLRDKYDPSGRAGEEGYYGSHSAAFLNEYRYFGTFSITLERLVLVSDETEVNASGAVISPLRYYVAGTVSTEVFTSTGETIP